MKQAFAPDGYLSVYDATMVAAEIPENSADDLECLDTLDYLKDAEALDLATKKLRQWLCDGKLTAYTRALSGEKTKVPKWTWTDDNACLGDRSCDGRFREFQIFSADGIKLNEIRTPVFVLENEFRAILKGDTKPEEDKREKAQPRLGRPKGSGSYDDNQWLDEVEKQVLDKKVTPWIAAQAVVANAPPGSIERKDGVSDEHVAQRLYKKYKASDRPQKHNSVNSDPKCRN